MGKTTDSVGMMKWKLRNFLQSEASQLINLYNTSKSPEQKREDMETIEKFTHYIDDYEKNIKIIEEYKEFELRGMDDGR